jgi:hypothetical protein
MNTLTQADLAAPKSYRAHREPLLFLPVLREIARTSAAGAADSSESAEKWMQIF